jgi:RimJ/RimL family protein N-acetyltransferase
VWKDLPRHQNRLKDYPTVHEDIYTNELGLPVSKPCPEWKAPQELPLQSMIGESCMLELLDPKHIADLWEAFSHDKEGRNWTYMPYGPFLDTKSFDEWLQSLTGKQDPITHAVIDLKTGKAVGLAAFINIIPDFGAIGIGHVNFSPLMQRSTISSEAIILMARKAFELGHRRLEWVCHKLNSEAVSAAKRYGFCYEGVFRNYLVTKGHNQDIAWFSITEEEWPKLDVIFTKWLSLAHNNEYQSLSNMIENMKSRKK